MVVLGWFSEVLMIKGTRIGKNPGVVFFGLANRRTDNNIIRTVPNMVI